MEFYYSGQILAVLLHWIIFLGLWNGIEYGIIEIGLFQILTCSIIFAMYITNWHYFPGLVTEPFIVAENDHQ